MKVILDDTTYTGNDVKTLRVDKMYSNSVRLSIMVNGELARSIIVNTNELINACKMLG